MANNASAKKRIRVSERNRLRNKSMKSKFRTFMKKFEALIGEGKKEEASETYKLAQKSLDKAALRGAIHKNNAARHKAQMANKLNAS